MESPFKSHAGATSLPPPRYVHYLPQGEVLDAWRATAPSRRAAEHTSAAQKVGLRFQASVAEWLSKQEKVAFEVGPWFRFEDSAAPFHYCQPDFLLHRSWNELVLVEAKTNFSADAWWQLKKLYLPVVKLALGRRSHILLCICRSFDPAIPSPEPVNLIKSLVEASSEAFNVLVLDE